MGAKIVDIQSIQSVVLNLAKLERITLSIKWVDTWRLKTVIKYTSTRLTGENCGDLELIDELNLVGDMKLLGSWLWTNAFGILL